MNVSPAEADTEMYLKSKILALVIDETNQEINDIVKTCCGRRKVVLKVNSSSNVLHVHLTSKRCPPG